MALNHDFVQNFCVRGKLLNELKFIKFKLIDKGAATFLSCLLICLRICIQKSVPYSKAFVVLGALGGQFFFIDSIVRKSRKNQSFLSIFHL